MFISRVRVLAALLSAAAASPALAEPAEPADPPAESEIARVDASVTFTISLVEDAALALNNEAASEEDKLAAFRDVLEEALALEAIGKFIIGDARKSMSDEQLARYDEVFPPYITNLYAEQFQRIVDKPLEVLDTKEMNARDTIVRTQFVRAEGDPIPVDWRVRQLRSGEMKILDIMASGVSIMLVKREEFASFVATNGVDALLDRLEAEA